MPLAAYQWGLIVAAAAVVLLAAFRMASDAPVVRQLFRQFFLLVFLPLLTIMGLPLVVAGQFIALDERVWQALIAGLVIAAGWLTTAIFAQLDRSRVRAERLRDYHKALFAEIRHALSTLYDPRPIEARLADVAGPMQSDPDYVLFVPKEHHDRVFEALVGEIDVLPRQTIDTIVAFYSSIRGVAALAEDMREPAFAALALSQRLRIYRDYLEMRENAFIYGDVALVLIRAFAEGGAAAANAKAVELKVSSPDAGRSGPSPGRG